MLEFKLGCYSSKEDTMTKYTMKIQSADTSASALGYKARRPDSTPILIRPWLKTYMNSTRPDTCFDNCNSYKIDITMGLDPLERYWIIFPSTYIAKMDFVWGRYDQFALGL